MFLGWYAVDGCSGSGSINDTRCAPVPQTEMLGCACLVLWRNKDKGVKNWKQLLREARRGLIHGRLRLLRRPLGAPWSQWTLQKENWM